MRKRISVIGILWVLVFRYPPLPAYRFFHKIEIVQACRLSVKKLALQFHLN